MTPDRRMILALFALAFGLRILYAVMIGTSAEINPNPYTYDFLMGRKIAAGFDWWSQPISPKAPGYHFLLAIIFKIGGVHRWLVILLQAFLGGVTAFFMYRIGENCFGRGAGLLSALWLCIYVHHMHATSLIVRDITATTLVVFVCYLMALHTNRMRGAVWTAIAYTLLVHVDPQYLLFFPVIVLYFLLWTTRHKLLNVQFTMLFLGSVLVLFLPWTFRNARVYGEPIPIGLEAIRYARPVKHFLAGRSDEVARVFRKATSRTGWRHNSREFWRVVKFSGGRGYDNVAVEGGGPSWSIRHNLISILNYGVLLPFFLVGIWLSFKKRNRVGLILSGAVVGYYLIRSFYGANEQARLPAEPLIILLAFYAIVDLFGRRPVDQSAKS